MQQNTSDKLCPVCERPLGTTNLSRHHWTPKSRGGKVQEYTHNICHAKIHATFTNAELDNKYSDPELVRAHPEMVKFIAWVRKKPPEYYDKNMQTADRRRKNR
jgi:hypothetical protein